MKKNRVGKKFRSYQCIKKIRLLKEELPKVKGVTSEWLSSKSRSGVVLLEWWLLLVAIVPPHVNTWC